jgi:2,4-dienoyl-CoA reductase-like NADH-dependent reductase (Old Yellow Enzyme family)
MMSPMCQYSAEDGFTNDWHLVHLGTRAVGGAGIICTEGTAVSPEGRISYADLGLWKDEHIEGFSRITRFLTEHGAVPAIQLAHAGRKASKAKNWDGHHQMPIGEKGWETLAPSPIPFKEDDRTPIELDKEGIQKVIQDFREAAIRAKEAGFRIIELHGAHGYLFHSFASPLSNQRKDEYGGSFENRIRLIVEVTDAVREVWPEDLPIFYRVSASDWMEETDSWDIEQSIELARVLKDHGVDLIDASSGGAHPDQKIIGGAGYQTEFAARIRKEAGIATGAVGLITSAGQAEHVVRTGQADLVIMAREFLRNPYFPLHAASELKADIEWPDQYLRAKK